MKKINNHYWKVVAVTNEEATTTTEETTTVIQETVVSEEAKEEAAAEAAAAEAAKAEADRTQAAQLVATQKVADAKKVADDARTSQQKEVAKLQAVQNRLAAELAKARNVRLTLEQQMQLALLEENAATTHQYADEWAVNE
mgnify:CR=1 FL=1